MTSAQNIETKVRYADLAAAARLVDDAGAEHAATLLQRDTYFRVADGRLKVREIDEHAGGATRRSAELIAYRRPDSAEARISSYSITPLDDAEATIAELRREQGLRAVVTKRRELWLLGSTRIHLDEVDGLGTFIELESVDDGRQDEEALWEEHRRIRSLLSLDGQDPIAGSYVDLMEASTGVTQGATPSPYRVG